MSLLAALSASLTGLDAAQRNVQLSAHNAANVHTDGYSRKSIAQSQLVIDGIGMGVDASEVRRLADDHLNRELRTEQGALAYSRAIADVHDRLQLELFGRSGDDAHGVSAKIAELAGAFESYANNSDSTAARIASVAAVDDFAEAVDSAGRTIQELRAEIDARIAETVRSINADLAALHDINVEVAAGGATPDLLDQRDRLLESLAGKIDITVAQLDRGAIAVYARGGTALVEFSAKQLYYQPAATVSASTVFGSIAVYEVRDLDPDTGEPEPGAVGIELVSGGVQPTTELRSGRLAGLLQARDHLLPTLASQYDELAELARFALNAAHNEAWPSPPPASLTGTRENAATAFDAATRSGAAYAVVVNRTTGATEATIDLDLSLGAAGLVSALNASLTAWGGSAAFDADGKLVVQVDDDYGLAFAAGDGVVTETDTEGRTRNYGFAHFFGLNDLLVRSPDRATALSLAPALANSSARLGHARVDVDTSTLPAVGTLGGVGDNRGALDLGSALEAPYTTLTQGQIPGRAVGFRTYATDIVAVAAQAAAAAERAVADRSVMVEDLEARRSAISGVSLDEELARLALHQQSYAASARILAIVDELFDVLLQSVQ